MPSIAAEEEVSQLAEPPKHILFLMLTASIWKADPRLLGLGSPDQSLPGENRQLNFAPVSVCRVGVDVAFCELGVRVSLLPCPMVEEYASAAWVLENCWLGSSKSQNCQGCVPLSMGYLPSEGHLQPPLLFLSTATPSLSKY